MSPTARELLEVQRMDARIQPKAVNERMTILAARIEKVLTECEGAYYETSICKDKILRILNGGEA